MRREFPLSVRKAAWARSGGSCESCGIKIIAGIGPEYDHINPDSLTGEPTLDNCAVLCVGCHRAKSRAERAGIAKAHRLDRKAAGLTPRKARIGDERYRRKVNGTTVRRDA